MAEWQPNQFARFTRNADYYVKDQPVVDEVMFKRLEKAETLIPNLKSGGVDAVLVTSAADVAPLKGDPISRSRPTTSAASSTSRSTAPSRRSTRRRSRQALSYSLNRVEMAKTAFFGVSKPISHAVLQPQLARLPRGPVNAHTFDLDKAAKLLEAAGAQEPGDLHQRHAALAADEAVHAALAGGPGEDRRQAERQRGRDAKFYDIALDPNMQGDDIHPWLNGRVMRDPAILWSTQANFRGNERNIFGYRNAEMEKLIADAAVEPDAAKRKAMYQRLNEIVVDDAYLIHVATNPRIWAMKKGVNDFSIDLIGNIILNTASVS